jgi:hypothetical protein
MAYRITEPQIGFPPLNDVSTTQKMPLGQIARITDIDENAPNHAGEVIYLKASGASIVVGSMVDYDTHLATAVLSPATAGVGPVAVSLNIVPAASFAWFQIAGRAAVKAPNAMAAGADVFSLAATPGSVDDAAVAGEQILGAKVSTTTGTPSAGLGYIEIARPFHQGQIT